MALGRVRADAIIKAAAVCQRYRRDGYDVLALNEWEVLLEAAGLEPHPCGCSVNGGVANLKPAGEQREKVDSNG